MRRVREAYAERAVEYINLFADIDAAAKEDREQLPAWAEAVAGPIIDVGCGPGQWTGYLHRHGVDIRGVDPVPAFINEARQRRPGIDYQVGFGDRLDAEDASLGGVLAWFSLIHTEPVEISEILSEFARCVRPSGGLAIGFFTGATLAAFDHAVTTAYLWPTDLLCARVTEAGFAITAVHTRTDPGSRPQGTILAERCAP